MGNAGILNQFCAFFRDPYPWKWYIMTALSGRSEMKIEPSLREFCTSTYMDKNERKIHFFIEVT